MSMFKKNKLSSAIVGVLATSAAAIPAFAQDDKAIEEVYVTGIRASLEAAMDIKRDSAGVVDAISAEDIGKFPDTNLAESLQRITGVSISRTNGEGAEVTVRGFAGDYNMVTLNGRMMPAASVYGGGSGAGGTSGGATRAFDFGNLASESVSGVQVYKTGRADIATGGIGATINIATARPLDNPGLQASVGAKAVMDTTNRTGSDITPELSGLISWTDDSERFGVGLTASYQERDSGFSGAAVNDWNIGVWGEDNLYSLTDDAVIVNAPEDGQLYGRPNDLRYAFSDTQRTRTNAQLTLQFAPSDAVVGTLDYTYAVNEIEERRGEATSWFANNTSIDRVEFDNSPVASPLYIHEQLANKDHGFEQQYRKQENTLDSIGLNVDWTVNDKLSFAFDVHDSSAESLPKGPGNAGEIAFSMGAPIETSQWVDWSSDLPTYNLTFDDSSRGNNNGIFDEGDMGSQVARVFYAAQTTDITQAKIDGTLEFDNGRFDFGIETRAMESTQQNSNRYMALGDWGIANPGEFPDGLLEEFNLSGEFDDYNTSDSSQIGFKGNAEDLAQWGVDTYGAGDANYVVAYNPDLSDDYTFKEDTKAAYFQVALEGSLGDMPTNILAGVRYETTDVDSNSKIRPPLYLAWLDNNDFNTVRSSDIIDFSVSGSYDNLLPSFDFDIGFTDDLKGRFSYSKTMARANYGRLISAVSNFGRVGSTLNGTTATASRGNPGLLPLESDNLDISVEWYYNESSYTSVGFFEKRVKNFDGTDQVDETHFGVLDQTGGPRAMAAAAELESRGYPVDDTTLFVMMAVLDNPADFPGGADDYQQDADFWVDVATDYDILPEAGDPEMVFRTSVPVNNREAKINGAELAVQHFFGETGFGVQANYTIVRGDVSFDDEGDPGVSQFALLGLSDTFNLVGIYENAGFQARLAYNWRDEYLDQTNRGNSRNPTYVEAFSQIDLNVSYDVTDELNVFFEGLNVTGENIRHHGRSDAMMWYLEDLGPRYQLGARYTF